MRLSVLTVTAVLVSPKIVLMSNKRSQLPIATLFLVVASLTTFAQSAGPLLSWNEGKSKQAIMTVVAGVT